MTKSFAFSICLTYCFVSFIGFISIAFSKNTQKEIEIIDIKQRRHEISFCLKNKSSDTINYKNISYSLKKGKCIPQYYFIFNDTLVVKLLQSEKSIFTENIIKDSVFVDGKRIDRNFIIKPNEKVAFFIPSEKEINVKVIKVILSEQQILFATIP